MTRPPSEAVDLTHLIPHSQEHLFDIGNAHRLFPRPWYSLSACICRPAISSRWRSSRRSRRACLPRGGE
jgi:hypothetical protein